MWQLHCLGVFLYRVSCHVLSAEHGTYLSFQHPHLHLLSFVQGSEADMW